MKFTKNAMVALCATTSILGNGFNTFASAANETELNIVAWPGYIERGESDCNSLAVLKVEARLQFRKVSVIHGSPKDFVPAATVYLNGHATRELRLV